MWSIHPFTSDAVKQWPIERFVELCTEDRAELDLRVVLVGSSPDSLKVNDNIINMINKTSLPELAALLKRAS